MKIIEVSKLTCDEFDELDRNLPVIVPVGLLEAHGSSLTLGLDIITAEHFAQKICEETQAVLMPAIAYGFADEMREYPGTIGMRGETLALLAADLCEALCSFGFKKIIFLSGHGGNNRAIEMGFEKAWDKYPDLKPACWSWWGPAGITIHHADKKEAEFAVLTGAPFFRERARDYEFKRPWHKVRSRYAYQPRTGGVNGSPSQANPSDSLEDYQRILSLLVNKVNEAKDDRD